MTRHSAFNVALTALKEAVEGFVEQAKAQVLPTRRRRALENEVRAISENLGNLLAELDPVGEPTAVFDPSNPKLIGRFVALGLVAQERLQLSKIPKTYGSGVYAIYYRGNFKAYAPISGTETPIYVGTASPNIQNARTPYEQGPKLAERIAYHAKNISKATSTLHLEDFDFRSMVVQSGYEKQAESYLIHLFKPVWNKETSIVSGFGKHGDSSDMRKHGRSPWDTLHPARAWASSSQTDQKSQDNIRGELKTHFAEQRIYRDLSQILSEFLDELKRV